MQGAGKLEGRRCRVRLDGDRPLTDLHGFVVAAAAQKQPAKSNQSVHLVGMTRQDLAIARLGGSGPPRATVKPREAQVPFRCIEPTVADGRPQGILRAPVSASHTLCTVVIAAGDRQPRALRPARSKVIGFVGHCAEIAAFDIRK